MGRSTTPTFRIDLTVRHAKNEVAVAWTSQSWSVAFAGRPTAENLQRWVGRTEGSTSPGGCNEHLGVTIIKTAVVTRQKDSVVVATFERVNEGRASREIADRAATILWDVKGGQRTSTLPLPVISWD